MSLNAIKSILFFIILLTFLSCKGQIKNENTSTQNEVNSILKLDEKIWVIYQDQNNNYWFGSNGNGLFYYDGKNLKKYTTQDGLVNNTIRGIQEDKDGNIFIETPHGISKYEGKIFTTLEPITHSSNEWKLEPNDLWFGYNASDLYRYDGETLFTLKLPRKDLKKAFGIDTKGVPFKSNNYTPYSVYGVDKDKEGNIWFGTVTAGAFRFDGESFLWFPEKELTKLPDGRVPGVRSMLEDKDGYFWLSNFISKYKINDQGTTVNYKKLKGIEKAKRLPHNRLPYFNSGLSDKNGDLWMTTYTGGVWKYDGEKLINFSVKDGDVEALLIFIYEDNQGVLWLGTDNVGVFKFDGKSFVKFEIEAK